MGSCDYLPATFKKSVVIQNVVYAGDGQGGQTETWADGDTVRCSITPVKAWERYQAAQLQAPVTHKVVMRFNPSVTSASRLKFGDRVFTVKEVINPNEENRFLEVKAVEP